MTSASSAASAAGGSAWRLPDDARAGPRYPWPLIADFLIHNTAEVLTCEGSAPRIGARQADAGALANAVVAAYRGTIVFVGPDAEWWREGT